MEATALQRIFDVLGTEFKTLHSKDYLLVQSHHVDFQSMKSMKGIKSIECARWDLNPRTSAGLIWKISDFGQASLLTQIDTCNQY